AVGRPRRSEVRAAELGDLTLVTSVGIHDPELHAVGAHEPLAQQLLIRDKRAVGRMPRAIRDLLAVRRPPWTAVVAWRRREPAYVGAVDVHRVDVEISVLERGEDDLLPV